MRRFLCRCSCGNTLSVRIGSLTHDTTKSCGCLRKERSIERCFKHGQAGTRLYKAWGGMKQRCYNPSEPGYKYYGGRGIKMCIEWISSFESFARWALSSGYAPEFTLDRINTNGDYEPANCRWVTQEDQCNNTRRTRLVSLNGETLSISRWSRKTGIGASTIIARLNRGWSAELALITPPRIR